MACVGALASLAAACAPSEATLIVQVRTDLVPGVDFASIRTIATSDSMGTPLMIDLDANSAQEWGAGVRVAELTNLAPADYSLRVQLLDESGAIVIERPVRLDLDGSVRVVTVLLTRDCEGVVCSDGAASACLGGRCVPDDCTEDNPLACGEPDCASELDCPGPGGCAVTECTATGACFTALNRGMCGADEYCNATDGMCVGTDPPAPVCSAPMISGSGCGPKGIIRTLVTLGPGMGSMTGTVHVTLTHTTSEGGFADHIYDSTSGSISETAPAEVHLDFCAGGEMWSEENGDYNLWAFLDMNGNGMLEAGEPAGDVQIGMSCLAADAPCHSIVLDCMTGTSCVMAPQTTCVCDAVTCAGVGGSGRWMVCCG